MFRFITVSLLIPGFLALPSSQKHFKVQPLNLQTPRIINGDHAEPGQFPWQVALYITGDTVGWFCSGSLISEQWVLTAGNCVDKARAGVAVTGSINSSPAVGNVTNAVIFILHDDYSREGLANNIGLIKLAEPLIIDDNTAPIKLSSEKIEDDAIVTVAGWGYTSDDATEGSLTLNYINLLTITNEDCQGTYGSQILEEMICAESDTSEIKGICHEDSGSPAILNMDSSPVQVAIGSFLSTYGCETRDPSGFTRVANYQRWIYTNTGINF